MPPLPRPLAAPAPWPPPPLASAHGWSHPALLAGESLMDAHAHWFLLASALLALGAPIFGVYLILSMYVAERDEIIASEAPR